MAFCIHCGQRLAEEAKFCAHCGSAVRGIDSGTQRKMEYDGEVHKCPNCGEVIGAFVARCPSCGYELRGTQSANSIRDFSNKIEKVTTDDQKVTLIRNFPVSNTKEDIFEFMILASSNIAREYNEDIFNAWFAKFEQCYQKAKLTFGNDSDFVKIQNLYKQTTKKVDKEKFARGANKIGTSVSKIAASSPSPIFGIVVVLLGIYEVIRIIKGDFAGIDIIMVFIILRFVYKKTSKKDKEE